MIVDRNIRRKNKKEIENKKQRMKMGEEREIDRAETEKEKWKRKQRMILRKKQRRKMGEERKREVYGRDT